MIRAWHRGVLLSVGLLVGGSLAGAPQDVVPPSQDEERHPEKDAKSVEAITRGLEWLAKQQAKDGRWEAGRGLDGAGATGLALTAFLGAGHTHRRAAGEGKDYRKVVQTGLDYLQKKQDRKGSFGADAVSNALATWALCECCGLTADPQIKRSAQLGLNALAAAQDRTTGGWAERSGGASSLTATGWHLMAIKSGQMAGLNVPRDIWRRAEIYLDKCEASEKGSYSDLPEGRANSTATGLGLLCRIYVGVGPRNPALRNGINKVIKANPPGKTDSLDYEYFASQVMHHAGGEEWKFWSKGPDGKSGIRDVLLKNQVGSGRDAGSWPAGKTGLARAGGRLAATSIALLTLEIPFHHIQLYRRASDAIPGPRE